MIQRIFAFAVSLVLATACTHPGAAASPLTEENNAMELSSQQPPLPPVVTSGELAPLGDPAHAAKYNVRPVGWPLRFKSHLFGLRCYDTLYCKVLYDGMPHDRSEPSPPSSTYGPDYLKGWSGGFSTHNFPPPAQVTWRSRDGTWHEAEIDIGALFKDERVRHVVPREEVADLSDGKYRNDPSILVEVNDRTIRVYMMAYISTKHLQEPGNVRSDFRDDLILVKTATY